ncbi:MAG: hypothetical protein ACK4N5_26165, partial [Myxococcales bacterium]
MNVFRSLALAGALLVLPSCAKKNQLSAEYAEAQQRWTALNQQDPAGAALSPGADEVLALLGRVDPASRDAQAAAELKKQIEAERAEAKAALEAREKMLAHAENPPPPTGFAPAAPTVQQDEPPPPPAAAEPVAAAPAADETQPREGMAEADFRKKFDRCFEFKNPFGTPGGQSGDVWGLKDLSLCREQHRSFTAQSVLLMDGKIAAIRSNEELKPVSYKVVGGKLVPM